MKTVKRRSFLKTTASAAAVTALSQTPLNAQEAAATTSTVVVVHGTDIPKMLEAGIAKLGGWGAFIKPGAKVAIKPNVAWTSTPEQGGNTHPDLVRACVLAAEAKGASTINIPENTCDSEEKSFPASGIPDALKGTKARLYRPAKDDYQPVEIAKGKILKKQSVPKDILEADCLINMPVAKQHGGATLTLSIKNWMGSVTNDDRRGWHRDGLHQCIADFATFIKPTLTIIDATRILLNKGPRGPGDLDHPNEIILSTDTVAADAYAATLFKKEPFDIGYIKIAHEMGVGCGDLSKVKIERVEV
ncbi:MAG: DUF362 domain-containing protein [Verrucomicrobiota bacterium]|jgi:uncharacterized protein (DUF362 family)|nr:DUF362 domain-containing protein [Verrucomicrobiota bacterium]